MNNNKIRVDLTSLLFFLGILMAVGALETALILEFCAHFLDVALGNKYIVAIIIGLVSSVVDNIPLVAACMVF